MLPDGDELRQLIKKRMPQLGMNARSLSLAAGLKQDAVKKILSGSSKNPRANTVKAIMGIMGIIADTKKLVPHKGYITGRGGVGKIDYSGELIRIPLPSGVEYKIGIECYEAAQEMPNLFLFKGWRIFVDRNNPDKINTSSKILFFCETDKGDYLGLIRNGKNTGRYNIHSYSSTDIIEDVNVLACYQVLYTVYPVTELAD